MQVDTQHVNSEHSNSRQSTIDPDVSDRLHDRLRASAALHDHLCPRQVLGVRMGIYAGELLQLALPQSEKRLLTIVETDGCFSDGVAVATNCWVGRRTMRVEDYGKSAATFVDCLTGRALRLAPHSRARSLAAAYAPDAEGQWQQMLLGYQRVPSDDLFSVVEVRLTVPVTSLISRPGLRVNCALCGEEIINERQLIQGDQVLCRPCAGAGYYRQYTPAEV